MQPPSSQKGISLLFTSMVTVLELRNSGRAVGIDHDGKKDRRFRAGTRNSWGLVGEVINTRTVAPVTGAKRRSTMKKLLKSLCGVVLLAGLATLASAADKVWTGQISDSMCGASHMKMTSAHAGMTVGFAPWLA